MNYSSRICLLRIRGTVILLTMLFVLLGSVSKVYSQASTGGKRQGVYLGGQKGWNIFKSRKKYKHIKNKKRRKNLSKKNNFSRKRTNYKRKQRFKNSRKHSQYKRNGKVRLKKTRLGKKGSLYSYDKKKVKKRKGRFPKSKSQLTPKFTVYGSTGFILTGADENFNINDEVINIYSNYRISPHVTAGFLYNHTERLSAGLDLRAFRIKSKEETQLDLNINTFVVSPHIKYSLVPSTRKVSPYVLVGPTFSFTQIVKEETSDTTEIDIPGSGTNVGVDKVVVADPGFKTEILPLVGLKLGGGVDFKLSRKLTGFVQADLDFSSSRNSKRVQDYFDKNQADYLFYGVSFGIKYNFAHNSSIY